VAAACGPLRAILPRVNRPSPLGPFEARVDINADIGESFGVYRLGNDEALLEVVSSGNVACGFHAGDPSVMRRTVRLAQRAGRAIGAHPSFPDLAGFGRREMQASPQEVEDLVAYQIGALNGIARSEGAALRHVKPHGALYNASARCRELAEPIVSAVIRFDPGLLLMAPSGSELLRAGERAGLRVAAEVFADRAYEPDGSLVSRRLPGAVLTDPGEVVRRAIRMVRERVVLARDGSLVSVRADTICIHGDTPDAPGLAARLRAGLESEGIRILAPGTDPAGVRG
jgi:5-oxoprolinase (ATP-hydrolysing) subunit A